MARHFVDRFDHRARVDDGTFGRAPEERHVAADDVIEHDHAAGVADPAGVVRAFHAAGAGRLPATRDLCVLRNLPRYPGYLGLHHRRDRIGTRAHRADHLVDHRWRQVVDELEIHFHARCTIAGRQTLDLLVRE
ncbi:MAG: hypothetical protein WA742_14915 [Candidatus Cybelea sp.]